MDPKMPGEPASFGQSRFEIQVPAGLGTTQFAGHKYSVAHACASSANALVLRHEAEQGNRDENAFRVGCRFASNDRDSVPAGERAQSIVEGGDECRIERWWQGQRDERGGGFARHGGHVAKAAAECLVAYFLRGRFAREVDAFDDCIRLEKHQAVGQAKVEYRTIVSRPGNDGIVARQRSSEPADEIKFVHSLQETPRQGASRNKK